VGQQQLGFGWGKGRRVITETRWGRRRPPTVPPPNRVIREGEPICTRCGSWKSTHEDGTRDHRFTSRMAKADLRSETP
jgi:hypothetical protein